MYGPKWLFLLRYGSRDARHVDFLWVDGWLTDTPILDVTVLLVPNKLKKKPFF